MDIETLDVDGVLFVSCWALSYGDYDNSTQLERGNVRYLTEQHDWCTCSTSNMHIRDARAGTFALSVMAWSSYARSPDGDYDWIESTSTKAMYQEAEILLTQGGYGSTQAWIRAYVDAAHDYLAGLADYPELDSDTSYKVQQELEDEAWDNWILSDLQKGIIKCLGSEFDETEMEDPETWVERNLGDDELHRMFYEVLGGSSYIGVEGGGNVYVYRFDDMISEIAHDIAERYRRDNQPALEHTGLWPAERAAQGELEL